MERKIVVHTGRKPREQLVEEMEALDAPDVQVVLGGPCDTPAQVLEAVRDADVALCGREPYTDEVFAGAPKLKMVIRYGVGVDTIDLDAATKHGVVVGHLPDFCIREVANHALVLLLNCAKKVPQLDRAHPHGRAGAPRRSSTDGLHPRRDGRPDRLWQHRPGAGRPAQGAANARHRLRSLYRPRCSLSTPGVEPVSLDELARQSDYVSCHLPSDPQARSACSMPVLFADETDGLLRQHQPGRSRQRGRLDRRAGRRGASPAPGWTCSSKSPSRLITPSATWTTSC